VLDHRQNARRHDPLSVRVAEPPGVTPAVPADWTPLDVLMSISTADLVTPPQGRLVGGSGPVRRADECSAREVFREHETAVCQWLHGTCGLVPIAPRASRPASGVLRVAGSAEGHRTGSRSG